jgi:hypothetical protein
MMHSPELWVLNEAGMLNAKAVEGFESCLRHGVEDGLFSDFCLLLEMLWKVEEVEGDLKE